jgi:hypothetical protein
MAGKASTRVNNTKREDKNETEFSVNGNSLKTKEK